MAEQGRSGPLGAKSPPSVSALDVAHGGLLHDELAGLHLHADEVLDVSVNVNPYGPCAVVLDAVRGARIERYPDPTASPARSALAAWQDVSRERVVVGNGAVDLLWSIVRCRVRPGDRVVIVEPAFSEFRSAAIRAGAEIVEHRLRAEDDFALDPRALSDALRTARPRLVYLCTPANPTGRCLALDLLSDLARRYEDATWLVDLSFSTLSAAHREDAVHSSDRIVWLRSLTKDLALAGLRLGFVVAPVELARALEIGRPPWSVNAMAQAAAIAATTDEARAFVAASCTRLLADRVRLDASLAQLGLRVHPSETIFSLVDLGPRRRATDVREAMLRRHAVLVRDCTSFGLPHHIRLGARPPPEQRRVLGALVAELGK